MFGNIVHKMIEAHANGGDPFRILTKIERENRKLFRAERELYGDIVLDVEYIMSEYFDYWKRHKDELEYIEIRGKCAEHTFEIELKAGLVWKGTIDAFAEARSRPRLKWLTEHKSFSKEWSEDERWRNVQSISYRRAALEMGWPDVDGTVWDYIYSKSPSIPQLKKNREPSIREIVTLPNVVADFMKREGLKSIQCEKLIEDALSCRPKYFQRVFTPMHRDAEKSIFDDFMETVNEIANEHDKKKGRNIGRHCGWCDFEPLCRAAMTGGDEDFVKEREYTIDKDDPAEKVTSNQD